MDPVKINGTDSACASLVTIHELLARKDGTVVSINSTCGPGKVLGVLETLSTHLAPNKITELDFFTLSVEPSRGLVVGGI